MLLIRLFFEFARVGLFAVGGGLATVPFLYDISDSTGWFTHQQLTDMIAVSESTPGPIGVNAATYVGFTTAGVPGAIAATLGLIFPSVIVIFVIARILDNFKESRVVSSIFYGLRPASTGLIAAAGVVVAKVTVINADMLRAGDWVNGIYWVCLALGALIWILMKKFSLHPVFYIALGALAGILLKL